MTAPIVAGFETGSAGFGTVATVLKPAGTAEGELLVLHVVSDENPHTITAPAGFTSQAKVEAQDLTHEIFAKIAGANEPADYAVTVDGNEAFRAFLSRITGHDPTIPLDGTPVVDNGASTTTPVSPSITTTGDDRLILLFLGRKRWDEDGYPDGTTGRYRAGNGNQSGGGNSAEAHLATAEQATAGATGDFGWSFANASAYSAVTVAIQPPDTAGDVTAAPAGVNGIGAIGTPGAGTHADILATGVSANGRVGEPAGLNAPQEAVATPFSLAAGGAVGPMSVAIVQNAAAALTGVSAAATEGSISGGNPWTGSAETGTDWSTVTPSSDIWSEAASATGTWN